LAQNLDLVIEYQVDEQTGNVLMDRFRRASIPVIAVDIPIVGATFFGVDNFGAGHMAGAALGRWIREQWQGQIDRLLVLEEPRAGATPAARMQGQLAGLQEIIGTIEPEKIVRLDAGNAAAVSEVAVAAALDQLVGLHRHAVISFNDDVALGALAAGRKLGREQDLAIVGQGLDRSARREIRQPGSRIIGSTAYWPERYGEKLIPMVQKILAGEVVPPAVHMDHAFINGETIQRYYPE
jgi:ribose transport system substrate-binding protein